MRTATRNSGSVLLMVIGLLTIIAMLGAAFVITANLDRKSNRSISTVAPMDTVAAGAVAEVVSLIGSDQRGTTAGAFLDPNGWTSPIRQIDYPHEKVDKWLASTELDTSGLWRHLTHILRYDDPNQDPNLVINLYTDRNPSILASDPNYVDTAGWGLRDARLAPTGMRTLAGGDIRVAIRVIDAGGLLNLSTAYRFDPTRDITQPMPMTDVAIQGLNPTGFAQLTWDLVRERIHNDATRGRVGSTGRPSTPPSNMLDYNTEYVRSPVNPAAPSGRWEPFDSSEMVSLASSTLNPDANSGRIASLLADQPALYTSIRRYVTPWAVTRNLSRHYSGASGQALYSQPNYVKVDLNRSLTDSNTYAALANAFYNAIPAGAPGFANRGQIAAQMAINVAQFRSDPTDANNKNPFWYTFGAPFSTTVFGVTRQPFVSKVFCKLYRVDANATSIRAYSAIELMNPFNTPIDLAKYSISGGGLPLPKSLSGTIPAATASGPGKLVIASHDATKIPIFGGASPCLVAGLDLSKAAKIVRTFTNPVAGGDKTGVIACLIPTVQQPTNVPGNKKVSTVQWDDRLQFARYTIASARGPDNTVTDYTSATADGGTMTAANTVIGKKPNNDIGNRTEGPCPVYVRGGPFLNVGELSRILYVGPTDATITADGNDLMRRIDAVTFPGNPGRFDPTYMPDATNTTAGYPKLPIGALFADHLTVMSGTDPTAQTAGGYPEVISGQININTAPKAVLRCLPPMFADPGTAEALISAIVAYRDNTDPNLRPAAALVKNYRNDASDPQVGFLSVGELAMPLWMKAGPAPGLGKLPQNVYRLSPEAYTPLKNYALDPNGGDDGLRIETTGPQARVDNDLPKKHLYYSWLSNHVAVRSDTFIVFIRVQVVAGTIPTAGDPYQRYVAVIDRSRMRSGGTIDRPQIVLFAQVR